MPHKARGGPSPGDRLAKSAPAKAAKPEESTLAPSVRRGRRARQYTRADASLYAPVPGRGRTWLSIRCPRCGGVHLARLRPGAEPGGRRRTPCGTVWVVVRSQFGKRAGGAT